MLKRTVFIAGLMLIFAAGLQAQKSEIYTESNKDFRNGLELFDKEKYGAAREAFEGVLERITDPNDEIRVNAEYYHAVCALELFNKDAEHLLTEFIRHHPESPRMQSCYFQLGKYHYRRKKFKDALKWFDMVDEYKLDNKELAEFYFKKGYSHFREGNLDEADKYFYQIREAESDYRDPALYFHSHIQYEKGNYQTALNGFEQLKDHPSFGKVVPYYIAQIFFLQKKYDELIAYAPTLLESQNVKREAEIAHIIGKAYYEKGMYEEAVPYFEKYLQRNGNATRDDRYQMGYTYYKVGDWDKALKQFNRVTDKKDAMTQLAYYHIADAYLKKDDKTAARDAFGEASKLKFDPEVEENALYNYAKLSYELDYNPYHEAVIAFEDYLNRYPDSDKKEEAWNYLINVYMTTHNYQKALESLDKIPNKNMKQQTAYQLVAFNAGVELFANGKYKKAIDAFNKVHNYPIERDITNEAVYWTGESYYRLGEFENAIVQYVKFQGKPGAILSPRYATTNYNIGYAYVKKKQYPNAISYFRKFTTNYKDEDRKRLNDAYLRIGDSYYIQRKFSDALHFYDKAIEVRLIDTDYAMLQKSTCYGLAGNQSSRITQLRTLITDFPSSPYLVDAKFQLAEAYRLEGQKSEASKYYRQVVQEFPNSLFVKRALLQIGLIQYQNGETNEAIATLKRIANESTSMSEANDGLKALKSIYSDMGQPNEYIKFVESLPYWDPHPGELDTLQYEAARDLYFAEKCNEAVPAFTAYLNKFRKPIFEVEARYYRAMCNYNAGKTQEALKDLNFIASLPSNIFSEDALLLAGRLNYENDDYQAALANYMSLEKIAELKDRVLEAQIGQMRCFHRLGNCSSAIQYADKVISADKTTESDRVEAHMTKGHCYKETGDLTMAKKSFDKVSKMTKAEAGSEAQYYVALILHQQGKYDESDEEVREMLKRVPTYDHWVAMSFLVLAENAIAIEDYFQAKATLQSIIDHHDGADVVRRAQERLDWIIQQESKSNTGDTRREDFNIEMDGYKPGQEKLYEDDPGKEPKERRKGKKPKDGDGENPGGESGNPESPENPGDQ